MSTFSEECEVIEPLVAQTVKAMRIQGNIPDLEALFGSLNALQIHVGRDRDLALTIALLCEAAIKVWLEKAEARSVEAASDLN